MPAEQQFKSCTTSLREGRPPWRPVRVLRRPLSGPPGRLSQRALVSTHFPSPSRKGSSGNFVADKRPPTTEVAAVKECPQPASFAGQRPSDLPSPGHRPGTQDNNLPEGPTARPFATNNGVVALCHNRTLKSGCTSSSRPKSDEGFPKRNHFAIRCSECWPTT
jgi:hypothetical protein